MGMVWRSCYRGGFHTPRPSVESPGREHADTESARTTSYDVQAGPPEPPARQCRIDVAGIGPATVQRAVADGWRSIIGIRAPSNR